MHAKLESIVDGPIGGLLDGFNGFGVHSVALGKIRVRLEQPRTSRTQGAIDRSLDGANGKVLVDTAVCCATSRERGTILTQHQPETYAKNTVLSKLRQKI